MGKTVTYGIGYTRVAKVPETLKKRFKLFKSLCIKGKKLEAAQSIIDISEWLLDLSDESDDPDDPEITQHFPKIIEYSEKAIRSLEEENDTELLPRAYNDVCQCYLKIHLYESAIRYGILTVNAFKKADNAANKSGLQNAYKVLADIYFTKSLNANESRFEDFRKAHKFYKLEREVIDTMVLNDIPEPEEGDLEKLKQSSHFNMGVMEAKIPSLFPKAQQNLQDAIKLAKALNDSNSEKTAWWELGNLYKRTQQYDNVKLCQNKELRICKANNFYEDYYYCFEEKLKLHLLLEEYDQCNDFYNEAKPNIQPEFENKCKKLLDMIRRVKLSWDCIQRMINAEDRSAPIANSFLEHIQLLSDNQLYRITIRKVDTELASLVDAGDYSNLIYVQLLLFKVKALWELREVKKDVYLTACNEVFDFIGVSLSHNMMDKLRLSIKVLKIRVKVHNYFGDTQQRDSYKMILNQFIKEENLEKQKIAHQTSMSILEQPRITPAAHKVKSVTIYTTIMTAPDSREVKLKYIELPETVQFLMKGISEKCWIDYGIQPILSHLHVSGRDIFPEDSLQHYIKNETHYIRAFTKGAVKKLPLELYRNAASRFSINMSPAYLERLSRQSLMELDLSGLDIDSNQTKLVQEVLRHTNSIKKLDLAANYLFSASTKNLFHDAYRGLTELNLNNNQLDITCLDSIVLFTNLMTLNLSYNDFGPSILQRLPDLLEKVPTLRDINLEGTRLGSNIEIDDYTKDAYTTYGMTVVVRAGISLNISNNHFEDDMLWHWTKMWVNLRRISSITLSNITSESGWDNFHSLSDLPKLSDLIFSFSSKSTLAMCNFNEFFKWKPEFNHLDFTCCDLTAIDIKVLANSLGNLTKLKKLTLNSNPNIGDEGIYSLNEIVSQSKIQILYVSHCGLTAQSQIAPWTFHLKEIDLTENLVHDDGFVQQLNKDTFIRIDDYKGLLSEDDKPETRGLSYRHISNLPSTPFG